MGYVVALRPYSTKLVPDRIETQPAHADPNKIRGAYKAAVHPKHRTKMLQWWADFIDQQMNVCRIAAQ